MNPSKYTIIKQIGGGQQGKIFLAKTIDEIVAIKQLVDNPSQGDLKLLPSIKHPGIIKFRQKIDENGVRLVLEYASQGDLATYINRNFADELVPEQLVRSWLLQLSLALYYLHHEMNVIHRDIKLKNVLVMQNGQIKLADFGLAKQVNSQQDFTKSTVGTPYYLSPEALHSGRSSNKSDMWGLGCLLYQICTGQKPFKGVAFGEIIKNILQNVPEDIPKCYSKWLSDLIYELLDKTPEKRPSVQTILQDEEMQRQFITLKAQFKDYEKINYPVFNLKTAKNYVRQNHPTNIKIFSESLKTTKRQKSIRIPVEIKPEKIQRQKKVQRIKFVHKSLKTLIQRKIDKQ